MDISSCGIQSSCKCGFKYYSLGINRVLQSRVSCHVYVFMNSVDKVSIVTGTSVYVPRRYLFLGLNTILMSWLR